MLCQKCGLTEATVHKEETVYRQKIEQHLCALCAGTGDLSPGSFMAEETYIYTSRSKQRTPKTNTPPAPPSPEKAAVVFAGLAQEVAKFSSAKHLGVLGISPREGPKICLTGGGNIRLGLSIFLGVTHSPDLENSLRAFFFQESGLPIAQDRSEIMLVSGDEHSGLTPDELNYRLPAAPEEIARLVVQLLTTCLGVQENDLLEVSRFWGERGV